MRRFLARALLLFTVFYIFAEPASAAQLTHLFVGVLGSAADSIASFLTGVH
ncbi:hypothetical protein [Acrocarpospora catenulata]|uniref:hypothetical protein n=1 Tax=Acrocarpospora catenulata TaxID=2836182 RepID=UPI001BD9499D|nr:hypothetical protein [Acrocarpospora catenulata]